jgi:hypothetical protein
MVVLLIDRLILDGIGVLAEAYPRLADGWFSFWLFHILCV